MKPSTLNTVILVGSLLVLVPGRVLAIGGCVDSPEEPTLALGLLGFALFAAPLIRARMGRR